jgi:hypothetical protein
MTERPFTNKSNYGQDLLIIQFWVKCKLLYRSSILTRLVNKLPNIDTDVP